MISLPQVWMTSDLYDVFIDLTISITQCIRDGEETMESNPDHAESATSVAA